MTQKKQTKVYMCACELPGYVFPSSDEESDEEEIAESYMIQKKPVAIDNNTSFQRKAVKKSSSSLEQFVMFTLANLAQFGDMDQI